jgi:hypothetical protein
LIAPKYIWAINEIPVILECTLVLSMRFLLYSNVLWCYQWDSCYTRMYSGAINEIPSSRITRIRNRVVTYINRNNNEPHWSNEKSSSHISLSIKRVTPFIRSTMIAWEHVHTIKTVTIILCLFYNFVAVSSILSELN